MLIFFGAIAIISLFVLVGTKYYTMNRLQRLKLKVLESEKEVRKAHGELTMARSHKAAAELTLKEEEARKRGLEVRVEKYDRDLKAIRK